MKELFKPLKSELVNTVSLGSESGSFRNVNEFGFLCFFVDGIIRIVLCEENYERII